MGCWDGSAEEMLCCLARRRPDCLAEAIRALGLLRALKPSCRTGVVLAQSLCCLQILSGVQLAVGLGCLDMGAWHCMM